MKKEVKDFLLRGMMFGGFGPIIGAIVYLCINLSLDTPLILTSKELAIMIFSTYILAFVHAGASVFNQMENWSTLKSLLFHSITLYIVYIGCYLVNSWIPFNIEFVIIFSVIFFVTYMVIWLIIYFILKITSNKLNKMIK